MSNTADHKLFREGLLDSLRLEMNIPSNGAALAPAVQQVVGVLRGFLQERDLQRIELALDEVIQNAYEHGNLGVTFDEKRKLLDTGEFEAALAERSLVARESGKMIKVVATIASGKFSCLVVDQGKGFDWRKAKEQETPQNVDPSGRGLILIGKVFDEVLYNEKGNEVTLTKVISPIPSAATVSSAAPK